MSNHSNDVEILPEHFNNQQIPHSVVQNKNWFRLHRLLVFSCVFGLSLVLGLFFVFIRSPIYLSNATLLTVAPTTLGEHSSEADIQHIIIQTQILTGQPILEKTRIKIDSKSASSRYNVSVDEMRSMLTVIPVAETNLVKIQAEGNNPDFLQLLINSLLEVYRQVRAEYISETTNLINASLDEELRSLEEKTQVKRDELDQFRQDNNILSTDVNDNQARVRLQGLNDSLNKASEEEVSAKARLEAVKMAMARGEALVPLNETESLAALEEKAQDLRELDAEIRSLYTPAYIKLRPDLNRVPEQLARIETKINAKLTHGKDSALTEARLEYQSAKQSVANIRKQLTEHKLKATKFTSQFSKYEALLEELLNLEKLFRETQQRLTALDINQRDKYPQVDVIDWAFLPHEPVGPLYMRDAGIALGISFFLGLLAVWLAEFLTREETQQSAVTLSGIHLYRGEESMALENQAISNQLSQNPIKLLENNFPRELTAREVNTLLKSADEQVRQLLLLLISGLTLEEAEKVTAESLDLSQNQLTLASGNGRQVPLSPALKSNIDILGTFPAWQSDNIESSEDLSALITYTAIDSGIDNHEDITAEALRHTYIVYLVSQGVRLSELQGIVGLIPPSTIARYGHFSPGGAGIPISEISLVYPVNIEL